MNTKKLAQMGLLIALAFILSYLETLVPIQIGIPGVKLGLANLVVVMAIYVLGYKEACLLSIVRVLLVSITFGNMNMLMYSLAGSFLSLIFMVILHKTKKFSIISISIVGGLAHNIGQLMVASLVLRTLDLKFYLGFLIICGMVTGMFIGIISQYVIKHLKNM